MLTKIPRSYLLSLPGQVAQVGVQTLEAACQCPRTPDTGVKVAVCQGSDKTAQISQISGQFPQLITTFTIGRNILRNLSQGKFLQKFGQSVVH